MHSFFQIIAKVLPDKIYLRLLYFKHFGYFPDLKNPKTYNEKLQWLKLNNRNPLYTNLVDKITVKEYVANIIGEEYIIPTINTYSSLDDIEFDKLPNQFVIKWNHDSGSIVICKDKSTFNKKMALNRLKSGQKLNGYWYGREWPYKRVLPKVMVEEYKEDEETKELRDYKFFCFNGEVKAMFIASSRHINKEPYFDFYDANFNWLNVKQKHPNSPHPLRKPKCFDEMKRLASKLSKGFPHVRVDLYEVNGRVYFGEYTFYHFSGIVPFIPKEFDELMGSWINLKDC